MLSFVFCVLLYFGCATGSDIELWWTHGNEEIRMWNASITHLSSPHPLFMHHKHIHDTRPSKPIIYIIYAALKLDLLNACSDDDLRILKG